MPASYVVYITITEFLMLSWLLTVCQINNPTRRFLIRMQEANVPSVLAPKNTN